MFKTFSVIAAFFLFSFNAQAFLPSPVVSKVCGNQDLSQQEKDEFLKYAFHNFLPPANKLSLSRGISNFHVSAQNSEEQRKRHCGGAISAKSKECQKIKKLAKTAYKYDVAMSLDKVKALFNYAKPAIRKIFKNCENPEENMEQLISDFDPSYKVLKSIEDGDYVSAQAEVNKVADLLNIPLHEERVSNPFPKKDPFSKKKVYEDGNTVDCERTLMSSLSLMDQVHLKTLEFLGQIAAKFAPAAPELKTK